MTSRRRRVLIADDEVEVRGLIAEYLASHGFDVVHAVHGLEALLCVKREQLDGVVLDINMPRLGGLEALKRIRALTPSTRVVVYSGLLEPELERQAIADGAVAVFSKPRLDDLKAALEGGEMPRTASSRPAPAVVNGDPPRGRKPSELRVLLVDDDAAVTELLSEVLALYRARTFSVTTAVDAVRLLAHGAPDVIFLDIAMPGLTGVEALPAIRALAPDAKVVMLSGTNDEVTARQVLARGAFDYIVKPIDLLYLRRTLETIAAMTAQGL